MRSPNLERRIADLERSPRGVCNCRRGQATGYHTVAELVAIMSIPCPVHGRRDLGDVVWVPPSTPLHPEDRGLCSCPPCAAREWREDKRGPLTPGEQEEEYGSWEQQLSAEGMEKVCQDQVHVQRLLRRYECSKRRVDGIRKVSSNKKRR